MHTRNRGNLMGALLLGAAAGAIAGVLLAPKSGKETRQDIMRVAEKMKGEIADRLSKLSEVTSKTYRDVVNSVVNRYQETKEVTKEQADELKEQLGQSYDEVKDTMAGDEDNEETDNKA